MAHLPVSSLHISDLASEMKIIDSIPKLAADGSNWATYRDRMVFMLKALNLADHLTSAEVPGLGSKRSASEAAPLDEAEAALHWERDDAILKQYIMASIPDQVFIKIKGDKTAKGVWDDLNTEFEAKSRGIRDEIERRLNNEKCEGNDDVPDHFSKMDSLREELAAAGGSIPDEEYAYILLDSLPEEYDTNVMIIKTVAIVSEKKISPNVVTMLITRAYEEKN